VVSSAGLLLGLGVVLWGVTWLLHGRHQSPMDTGVLQAVGKPDEALMTATREPGDA